MLVCGVSGLARLDWIVSALVFGMLEEREGGERKSHFNHLLILGRGLMNLLYSRVFDR